MADEASAQTPTTSAAPAGADSPQIDTEKVTLEQLDELMTSGKAELPMLDSGGEQAGKTPAAEAPVVEPPPKVEPPVVEEPKAKVEPEPPAAEVIEETRTAEEIAEAQTAARERVKAEGGDEAAQDAAAEEVAKPTAAAPDAPVVEPEPKVEDEDKGDRFRHKDPVNRAINALFKARQAAGNEITWAEAERLVKGDPAEALAVVEEVDHQAIVTTLETEVADIVKKLDDLGANEGIYNPEISKLHQEHANKIADLKLAKRDQRIAGERAEADARTAAEQSKQARATAKAKALEAYPAAGDDTTPLGKAVSERIEAMRNPNHPDHSILFADSAPLTIVRDVAAELGIQPVAKKAAVPPATPPAKPAPAAPPKSKMSPASGAKTSVPAAPPQEDAKKYVEHLKSDAATLDELDAVFEPGGSQKTLARVVG